MIKEKVVTLQRATPKRPTVISINSMFTTSKRFTNSVALTGPVEDTPGPDAYDLKTTLLDDSRHKHYGFLEKAKRFRSPSKDERGIVLDGDEEGANHPLKTSVNEHSHRHYMTHGKSEKEEIHKLKKEADKWRDQYGKITKLHEREIRGLEEKISRIDTLFQTCLKEKSALQSQIVSKEKECAELAHKQTLEKSEKIAQSYQDKAIKATTIQRKLDDVEKQQGKVKVVADKKLVQENELLLEQIKSLKGQVEEMTTNKDSLESTISQLQVDRRELKSRVTEMSSKLKQMNDDKSSYEARWKVDMDHLQEKLSFAESALITERSEYSAHFEESQKAYRDVQKELEKASESFESQRMAYLGRINLLESELESNSKTSQRKQQEQLDKSAKELQKMTEKRHRALEELASVKDSLEKITREKDLQIATLHHSSESLKAQLNEANENQSEIQEKSQKLHRQHEQQIQEIRTSIETLKTRTEEEKRGLRLKLEHSESTISELKLAVTQLKDSVSDLQKKLSSANTQLEREQMAHATLKERSDAVISNLEDQIRDLTQTHLKSDQQAKAMVHQEQERVSTLNKKFEDQTLSLKNLEERNRSASAQWSAERDHLLKRLAEADNTVKQSRQDLNHSRSVIAEMEKASAIKEEMYLSEKSQIDEKLRELMDSNEQLSNALESSQSLSNEQNLVIQRLEDSIKEQNETVKRLESSVEYSQAALAAREQTLERSQSSIQELESLLENTRKESQSSSSELASRLHSTEDQLVIERNRTCVLESELSQTKTILDQKHEMMALVESKLALKLDELCSIQADLETKNVLINDQNLTLQSFEMTTAQLQEDIIRHQNEKTELETKMLESSGAYSKRIEELLVQLEDAHAHSSSFMNLCETLKENASKDSTVIEGLESEKGRLLLNIEDLEATVKSLSATKDEAFLQINSLMSSLDEEKSVSAAHQMKIEQLELKVEELLQSESHLKLEISKAQDEFVELSESVKELEEKLRVSTRSTGEQVQVLQKEIQELLSEKKYLQDDLNDKVNSLGMLETQLKDQVVLHESQIAEFQEKLSLQNSTHLTEVEDLHGRVQQLNDELSQEQDTIQELEKMTADLMAQRTQLSAEFSTKEQDLLNELRIATESIDAQRAQMTANFVANEDTMLKQIDSNTTLILSLKSDLETLQTQLTETKTAFEEEKENANCWKKTSEDAALEATRLASDLARKEEEWTKELQSMKENLEASNTHSDRITELENDNEDLQSNLQFKSQLLQDYERQLDETKSRLSVAELRLMNEVSSRDIHIKAFEDRVRTKTSECEVLQKTSLEQKKSFIKIRDENKVLMTELERIKDDLKRYKELEKKAVQDRKTFELQFKDAESEVAKWSREADRLQIMVEELTRVNTEMHQEFETQLNLLGQRGQLNQNEIKKLGELNAEIFGHSNNRQKIKYVAQLKEENICLKKENLVMVRQRDDLRKKVAQLENENDAFKSLGGGGLVRKMNRGNRPALSSHTPNVFDDEDKENAKRETLVRMDGPTLPI